MTSANWASGGENPQIPSASFPHPAPVQGALPAPSCPLPGSLSWTQGCTLPYPLVWMLNHHSLMCQRIDTFELWCWGRLLRVPWTTRRSSQSILKEISPGCSLEGLMLKLKLQYFVYLMQRADSSEKTLMLGKIEGRQRRGR